MIASLLQWLSDPASWSGPAGIPTRLLEHLLYTAVTVLLAAVIAIPVGFWIGHTGKGRIVVVNLLNGARSIPTLGLLFLAIILLGPRLHGDAAFLVPVVLVLVVLAIPPVLAGAYSGIEQVDPAARDAARGMGMTGSQVLRQVEIPCAMPLVMSGLRSATMQVIATATIAATVSIGGLGRYLIDGQAARDYAQMAGGGILVAALALLVDLLLAAAQRLVVSPGLSGAAGRPGRRSRRGIRTTDPTAPEPDESSTPDRTTAPAA
ncbi:ABC transporter permease [Arsenicicoccus sp. oral taxon 190]|uniref:ABC transporter permease n=1 Tax=Arsenicicoccus sp. oral taxon 190 TaxID=1658671 RepID=UPI00067A1D89|nr:ABC transporter permease [Arsenicicoccus sp. oral taxon 190]AKT50558.1 ABC transporter permease [Arsenicicoccus sp. oral taxon 190]